MRNSFGERLLNARRAAKLSQEELAERIGVHPKTVSRWENDRQPPEDEHIQAIASLTKMDVNWLKYGADQIFAVKDAAPVESLPRQFRIMAAEFELEALKLGASESEMDYIRHALLEPETARMFAYGHRSREGLSEEALKDDYQALINALRTYVQMRVRRRDEEKRRS